MHIPKKYGQSRIDKCPFCGKQATAKNIQDVPVCRSHRDETLDDMKCACGSTLEMMHGKFGVFFSCIKCGSMNLRKVLDINAIKPGSSNEESFSIKNKDDVKTITVRSDDPRYFD